LAIGGVFCIVDAQPRSLERAAENISMWQLKDYVAAFAAGPFRIQINTARPHDGLTAIRCGTFDLAICPLQISAQPPFKDRPEPIDEVYVRGDDVIATYRLASERTARPQVVWSAAVDDETLALDLTVAMQTQLLASDPSLTSVTTAETAEVLMAVGTVEQFEFEDAATGSSESCGLFLFRLPDCDYSYAEMVYPPDYHAGQMKCGDGRLEYRLICEPLEKGVIRKAQLRGMLVPRQRDIQLASLSFRSLPAAAPPLTT
jgi:hypothetical protein